MRLVVLLALGAWMVVGFAPLDQNLLQSQQAMAQAISAPDAPRSPFGAARPAPGNPAHAQGTLAQISAWVMARQSEYTRSLTQGVIQLKKQNSLAAGAALALFSFLYGVFHAVGPGHGKAIISSYVLANERTARRGVYIAFLSSLFQALSAIILVAVLAVLYNASSTRIQSAAATIETVSAAMITLIGAWLLATQLRSLFKSRAILSPLAGGRATAGHGHGHAHKPAGAGHRLVHDDHHSHADHADGHVHDEHCGHQHLPDPNQLDGPWSWRRAISLALAVGIRPCSGAILMLVFALAQGLFWAGVVSTFVMALGTAITVSVLAILAVASRDWAARLGGSTGAWIERVTMIAGVGGSALVLVLGVVLFLGSLGPAKPFSL